MPPFVVGFLRDFRVAICRRRRQPCFLPPGDYRVLYLINRTDQVCYLIDKVWGDGWGFDYGEILSRSFLFFFQVRRVTQLMSSSCPAAMSSSFTHRQCTLRNAVFFSLSPSYKETRRREEESKFTRSRCLSAFLKKGLECCVPCLRRRVPFFRLTARESRAIPGSPFCAQREGKLG